jgi:hypothetical protein
MRWLLLIALALTASCQLFSSIDDLHVVDAPSPLGKAIVWQNACAWTDDGSTNHLDFDDGPFTVELWYRPDSLILSGNDEEVYTTLVWKGGSSTTFPGWSVETAQDDVVLDTDSGDAHADARAVGKLQVGHLYHVAATREGSAAEIFVLDKTNREMTHRSLGEATNIAPWSNTERLEMGGISEIEHDCHFVAKGAMDDVRIWSSRRSKGDLDESYAQAIACTTPGLVAYWPLDEGGGALLRDCAGHVDLTLDGVGPPPEVVPEAGWIDSPFDDADVGP